MDEDEIVELLNQLRDEAFRAMEELGAKLSIISNTLAQNIEQEQLQDGFSNFADIQDAIEEKLRLVEKADKITALLSYRAYKIRCSFCDKIDELQDKENQLKKSAGEMVTESQTGALININEQIATTAAKFEESHEKIKEQSSETQRYYESYVEVLDQYLAAMKMHFNELLQMLELKKQLGNKIDEMDDVDRLGEVIEKYTELQARGWRGKTSSELPDIKKYRFSVAGLIVTDSGRVIGYREALEKGLLSHMDIFKYDDNISGKISARTSTKLGEDDSEEKDKQKNKMGSKDDMDSKSRSHRRQDSSTEDSFLISEDAKYLRDFLGTPLTLALAEITAVQPRDPIHYLAHWLFKYRYNQELSDIQQAEFENLKEERQKVAQKRWHKFVETEARAAVIDMIVKAEEEAIQKELIGVKEEAEQQDGHVMFKDENMDKVYTYEADSNV